MIHRFTARTAATISMFALLFSAAIALGQSATKDILDEGKQKAIWDSEHITFEIEQRFGKPFRDALAKRDEKALSAWFHEGFTGSVISPEAPTSRRQKTIIAEMTRSAGTEHARKANSTMLIADLLANFQQIKTIKRTGFRVLRIFGDEKKGWTTNALLTVSGASEKGEPVDYSSKQDITFKITDDAEFVTGPCVSAWKVKSDRILTSPTLLMEEVTAAFKLTNIPVADNWRLPKDAAPEDFRFQMAVEDFDRDGFLDIAIASYRGATALLKSIDGQRFTIVNDAMGIQRLATRRERALATWIDFDNDGFPDLILGDRAYHNQKGKRFVEVTDKIGLKFHQAPMGAAVADYDGDGFSDLYLVYQYSPETGEKIESLPWVGDEISGAENALWRNLGNGRFEDVTKKSKTGCGARNSFAAAWLYADGDALPDLYVANDFGKNNLLRNKGDGTFEDISETSGVADFATSMGIATGDIDNDGTPEMYVANMYSKMGRRIIANVDEKDYSPGIFKQIKGACAGNRLYRREKNGNYSEWSEQWGINDIGWAYAPAMADFDNDGLLDLHATTGFLSFERGKPDG